uniref:Protein-lysine N-methyltransferase EEF2KMT-like n=1 Tax=Dermatophagoides pteronyssinus TaxID=6956 RepID=A0A6P6XSZ4_DERPT|nr:protein-lysine N-methyltransferase EEF2KMT-like [Dermatophagoides pteronyssinus]
MLLFHFIFHGRSKKNFMMNYNFKFVEFLFLQQTRLNVLIPFIRILIKWRIHKIVTDDNEDGIKKIRCLNDMQKELLSFTILNKRLEKYPLPLNYLRQFLKQLIRIFEQIFDADCLVDEIYPLYADLISIKTQQINRSYYQDLNENDGDLLDRLCRLFEHDENIGFVTHVFDTFRLSIIETNKIVTSGTTGLRTWPAAIHLLNYLRKPENYKNIQWERPNDWNNVVELGSGSGLLGVGLINSGFIKNGHYIFTDHSQAVLKHIELNLFINNINQYRNNNFKVVIQKLDWTDYEFFDFSASISDLIIASDVIYDPNFIEPFVRTLRTMFNVYKNADSLRRNPDCIICCAIRNPKLLNIFQQKLEQCSLEWQQLDRIERPLWVNRIQKHVDNLSNEIVIDENFDSIFKTHDDNIPSIVFQIRDKS